MRTKNNVFRPIINMGWVRKYGIVPDIMLPETGIREEILIWYIPKV